MNQTGAQGGGGSAEALPLPFAPRVSCEGSQRGGGTGRSRAGVVLPLDSEKR